MRKLKCTNYGKTKMYHPEGKTCAYEGGTVISSPLFITILLPHSPHFSPFLFSMNAI